MNADWQQRPEAGTDTAIRLTSWIALNLGRRAVAFVLFFAAAYFVIVRADERRASKAFLERVTGRPASIRQVHKHFWTFARVTADRVYFLSNRIEQIPVDIKGWEIMEDFVQQGRGCVMIGSHLGSFEAARLASIRHQGVRVRMIIDRRSNEKLMRQLESLNPEFAASVIDADQDAASLGLAIGEALKKGESVGFLGDRFRPGDRTTDCEFLGAKARLPVGPFIIASVFNAPVVVIFGTCSNGRYDVRCEKLYDNFDLPRDTRDAALNAAVQRYSARLEHYTRNAPYNWFNFYDFWKDA